MQHYISSKEMEVVVFWTKNLNTDTEDNHIVGNLGSISVQRKWKLHFSGLKNLKTDTEDHHMVGEAYIIEA